MVQSKSLRPDWLPAVALSAALAALMLAWNPQVGDLAAQVFRTHLFQQAGLAIWNGSWYGGHYTLTYSVLFPPLAALLGPQLVGTVSVVGSSYLFDRLVRDRWGEPARWATLWFAAGVVTLLADGQLTFALGVAFGLGSLRALQLGRGSIALLTAAACALSSPVAAAFLGGVLICAAASTVDWSTALRGWRGLGGAENGGAAPARRPPRGHDGSRGQVLLSRGRALGVAFVALGLVLVPNLVFPDAGQFPFAFSSFIAIPLWCGSALYVTRGLREEERQLRWTVAAYLLASTVVWLVPNAMGGNAVRLGALFGGPVLAAVVLARRPRVSPWFLALFMAGGLYWQVTASVSQIVRSVGDPSTSRSYFQPPAQWLREHGGGTVRVEVPPTANHWESAYLATHFELARGWLRQLDTTRDDIFYGEDPLTAPAYGRWLRQNAISYVALPDAALDYSSIAERRLILSAPPYLDLRWSSEHWRIYAVRNSKPLVEPMAAAAAQVLWAGRQGFALDVSRPGDFLVRVKFTPYWSIARGSGCILRHGDWTVVHAAHPGVFRVAADFSLGRAWNAVTGAKKTC
ncbi:MAG TPA: hypothetical protein VID51_08465 [Solirubrobacterales bacterium]|jgi:hypothetical protein